jgi:hypothetical protein
MIRVLHVLHECNERCVRGVELKDILVRATVLIYSFDVRHIAVLRLLRPSSLWD